MFFIKNKWPVNGSKPEKWTTEKFREKITKSSAALVRSGSTDYLFWEFHKIPQKNVSAPQLCGVRKYRPHHAVSL